MVHHEAEAKATTTRNHMDVFEGELGPKVAEMLQHFMPDGDLHPILQQLMDTAGQPDHASDLFLHIIMSVATVFALIPALGQPLAQEFNHKAFQAQMTTWLTPSEAATAVVKGILPFDIGARQASGAGVHPDIFHWMVDFTGNPPAPQELMEMLRRGIIDRHRFDQGIIQGLTKAEWVDEMVALRFRPPDSGTAVAGAVQNHISHDQARRVIEENGIDPANFGWMFETAGEPPGIHELLQELNRGLISESTVVDAIRESRVKDKYIQAVLNLRYHYPPERSIVSMVRHGALTEQQGLDHLHKLGFFPEDAAAMVHEATENKIGSHKSANEGQIIQSYETGATSRQEAHDHLVAIRYSPGEADYILTLADHRVDYTLHRATVARIMTNYVNHKIDRNTASLQLDRVGTSATERDRDLHFGDVQRDAHVARLTRADLKAAWKASLITDAEWVTRLVDMGYSAEDATMIVAIG